MDPAVSPLTPVFDRVYDTKRWTDAGNGSGPGSALGPDAPLIAGLRRAIGRFRVRSIVDVSCGGMAWWPHVLDSADDLSFHGFDVSRVAIAANRDRFQDRPWRFDIADARMADFPRADLVVCRQTLNHLWLSDAVAVVENILPRAGFVAITHDPALRRNDERRRPLFPDCGSATCYVRLNLLRRPFPCLDGVARLDDVDGQVLGLFRGNRAIAPW